MLIQINAESIIVEFTADQGQRENAYDKIETWE